MLPADLPDSLAARLGLAAGEPRCVELVAAAVQMLAPHVDPTIAAASSELYAEAVLGLAVKIYDAGSRGLAGFDENGGWSGPTSQATIGLVRSVWGLVQPLTPTGGAVIA